MHNLRDATDIYTVGGISFLSQMFKLLVMIFSDSGYQTLLRLFYTLGFIFSCLLLVYRYQMGRFFGKVVVTFGLALIFVFNKADVTIIDTKFDKIYVVSRVPFGPALFCWAFSSISYKMTNFFSSAFHTGTVSVWSPLSGESNSWASAELDYTNTGFGGFFDYITLLKKMQFRKIAHPDIVKFNEMAVEFMKQCTVPEIAFMSDTEFETRFRTNPSLIDAIKIELDRPQ